MEGYVYSNCFYNNDERIRTNLQIIEIRLTVFRLRDLFVDGHRQPRVDAGLHSQVRSVAQNGLGWNSGNEDLKENGKRNKNWQLHFFEEKKFRHRFFFVTEAKFSTFFSSSQLHQSLKMDCGNKLDIVESFSLTWERSLSLSLTQSHKHTDTLTLLHTHTHTPTGSNSWKKHLCHFLTQSLSLSLSFCYSPSLLIQLPDNLPHILNHTYSYFLSLAFCFRC